MLLKDYVCTRIREVFIEYSTLQFQHSKYRNIWYPLLYISHVAQRKTVKFTNERARSGSLSPIRRPDRPFQISVKWQVKHSTPIHNLDTPKMTCRIPGQPPSPLPGCEAQARRARSSEQPCGILFTAGGGVRTHEERSSSSRKVDKWHKIC